MQNMVIDENKSKIMLPSCKCGHSKMHHMVQAKGMYTGWRNFLILLGISCRPLKVRYLCLKCNEYFDETTEENTLKNFY